MRHARDDYNRIQDPAGKIADDEPVFLLRAKDITAPETLRFWAANLRNNGGDERLATLASDHATEMEIWQRANGCKMPDL